MGGRARKLPKYGHKDSVIGQGGNAPLPRYLLFILKNKELCFSETKF
jgi:hypothetical protein